MLFLWLIMKRIEDESNTGPVAKNEKRSLYFNPQFECQLITNLIADFRLQTTGYDNVQTVDELFRILGADSIQGFYDYVHHETPLHDWFPKRDPSKGHILESPIKGYSKDFAIKSSLMQLVSLSLVRQLTQEELEKTDYIVGFAESGIAVASSVSLISGIPMIATRTTQGEVPIKNRFVLHEPGAPFEGLYTSIPSGTRVWGIDDELTKGWTLTSFYKALVEQGIHVVANSVVFEILGNGMDGKNYFEMETGRRLYTLIKINLPGKQN